MRQRVVSARVDRMERGGASLPIRRAAFGAVALLSCLSGAAPPVQAQGAGSATLRGTVMDASGGVLPGADLTLASARTKASRRAVANAEGGYVFPALSPGPYHLRVELEGFAPWESGEVRLSPGDSLALDATLAIGKQTDELTVTAQRPMVRDDHGAREGLLTSEQIQNLSIISRGALELVRILPGTVAPPQSAMEVVSFGLSTPGTPGANDLNAYSINGYRGTNISPVLDGTKALNFGGNDNVLLSINPDMVDEVKVQSGNYAAEYGSSAVQITAVTKGGSSSFHGSVYDYWRNWRFSANDRSNNYAGIPRPKSDYHYPGFNLSGPVLVPGTDFNKERDTLFFFVGYEYQHQLVDQGTVLGVVPTPAQRRGDFSELLVGEGQNLGQPRVATIPWGFPGAGQPAPNNDLGPYMDPIGRAYLNVYPLPNYSDPENRYNYAFSTPLPLNRWQLTSRLDWNVTPSTHASLRLALERERTAWSRGFLDSSTFELPNRFIGDAGSWSVAVNVTSVLGPSLTNQLTLSATDHQKNSDWEDPAKVTLGALGLEGYEGVFPLKGDEAPLKIMSWGQGLGDLFAFQDLGGYHADSVSLMDNLTKVLDAHTIKLGLFVERSRLRPGFHTVTGLVGLAGPWTSGGTGNDFGDLAVGRMGYFEQQTTTPTGEYCFWNFEGYAQDSWRVRRNLTLELGLRISKMPNTKELTGIALLFEPSAYDHSQGTFIDGDPERPNGILLERRGEIPRGMTEDPGAKLMPRLNFAWDVRGNGDLTLRGGAGLFYNRPPNFPAFIQQSVPNSYGIGVNWWDVPGGLTFSSLSGIDPWSQLGTVPFASADPSSIHVPMTWNWSLAGAKRISGSQTLEVAYVGHRAEHLPNRTLATYVPPGALTGSYGNADLDNPLHRAALDSSVVAAHRLYPAYAPWSLWWQYGAESTYHGLQATLSRQAAGRVQYFINYTFSKVLGTTGDNYAIIDPLDPANRSYGIVPQDRTHIFNASYNVFLPDPIAPDGNGFLRHLLNGWQISGITSYRSGQPFRVVFTGELSWAPMALAWWGTDVRGSGPQGLNAGAITPVFHGDPRLGNTGVGEKILDIDQIGIPALGESGPFQSPYYFRAPSRWNWDLTVFKNFALGGPKRLQLRVGVFNLFNQAAPDVFHEPSDIDLRLEADCNVRVNGVPNGAGGLAHGVCDPTQGFHFTELTRENFGKIVTKRGHRVIELAVRFDF